jgi:hypothetical protein
MKYINEYIDRELINDRDYVPARLTFFLLASFDRDSIFARGMTRRCTNRRSLHWMGRILPPHCCYLKPTILATYAGCVLLCVMGVIYFCSALKLPDCLPCDARLDGAITSASIRRCCCATLPPSTQPTTNYYTRKLRDQGIWVHVLFLGHCASMSEISSFGATHSTAVMDEHAIATNPPNP